MFALMMSAALAVAGAAPPVAPPPDSTAPPPTEQVLALPDALRTQFRAQVLARRTSPDQRLDRLVHFMFAPEGLGMVYDQNATSTVSQAYRTRRANCLTFTLLAVALAREAGLDAYGQQIEETLAWRQEQNTIYRTNHVNAGVRIQQRRLTVDVAWDLVIARDPPQPIDDARLLAHYYNNRAAELMEQGNLVDAARHAAVSLHLDPGYPTSWSNAGVIHLRAGDEATAERYYRQALALQPLHPGALFNLVSFYQRSQQPARAAPLQANLRTLQARDPFHQFLLGTERERSGDLARAADHYRRAIRLYDGEHRFHFGLARVYFLLGDQRRAGKSLARARELSQGDTQLLYQAKLDTLRRLPH